MILPLPTDVVPLTADADGVIRVGGTRVTLDTIVAAFRKGSSPEGICEQYPSLQLAEVYSAIGYMLSNSDLVNEYLAQRQTQARLVRQQNETQFSPQGVRERLLNRRHKG